MKFKLLILILAGFLINVSLAAATTLQVNIPCQPQLGINCFEVGTGRTVSGPAQYIARLYQFSLGAAGLLALGIIVFAAVEYTVSAGSPALQLSLIHI